MKKSRCASSTPRNRRSRIRARLSATPSPIEAAADPVLSALTRRMLERETATTLPKVAGMEVAPYIDLSMARIRNTAIRHRCHQIGTDGSQKIVQRLVDPLRERLAAGQPADLLMLAVAGWIAYGLSGARRFGERWAPSDPYAETVIAIGDKEADWPELAKVHPRHRAHLRRRHGAPAGDRTYRRTSARPSRRRPARLSRGTPARWLAAANPPIGSRTPASATLAVGHWRWCSRQRRSETAAPGTGRSRAPVSPARKRRDD